MTVGTTSLLVNAAGRTDTGMVREANEDAFLIADLTSPETSSAYPIGAYAVGHRGVLLTVSDGMGGAEAGEVASALVVESLRDHLDSDCQPSEILESVRCAIKKANHDVWQAASNPGNKGMGATLVAVIVHTAQAYVACVGDSRVYLVRGGRILQVTKDQSYVEMLVDSGAMTRDEAEHSPYKNIITQAMGLRPDARVALGRLGLRRGDMFLLCSDGISGKVGDEEMLDAANEGPNLHASCLRLIELANTRGGEDNSTVIIAEIAGHGLPDPAPSDTLAEELKHIRELPPSEP